MIKVYCDACGQEIEEWLVDLKVKKHFCSLACKKGAGYNKTPFLLNFKIRKIDYSKVILKKNK